MISHHVEIVTVKFVIVKFVTVNSDNPKLPGNRERPPVGRSEPCGDRMNQSGSRIRSHCQTMLIDDESMPIRMMVPKIDQPNERSPPYPITR